MHYSFLGACFVTLAATNAVLAQIAGFDPITAPTKNEVLSAGQPYTIKWTPAGAVGKVSITLLQGNDPATLQLGDKVATSIDNALGQYVWTVPALNFKTFGLEISVDANTTTFQYSNPFMINTSPSSSVSSSSAAAASSTSVATVSRVSTTATSTIATSSTISAPTTITSQTSSSSTNSATRSTTGSSSAGIATSSSIVSSSTLSKVTSTGTAATATARPSSGATSNAVFGMGSLLPAFIFAMMAI